MTTPDDADTIQMAYLVLCPSGEERLYGPHHRANAIAYLDEHGGRVRVRRYEGWEGVRRPRGREFERVDMGSAS